MKCIENNIAVYSPHTSFDCTINGVNDWLINRSLGVCENGLTPKISGQKIVEADAADILDKNESTRLGYGRVYHFDEQMTLQKVIENVKSFSPSVSYATSEKLQSDSKTNLSSIQINSVGVCAGSGSSVLRSYAGKVDLIVTGELSHHEVLNFTENGTNVVLTFHSNSERGYLREYIKKMLEKELDNEVEVVVSEVDCDPLLNLC